MKKNIASLVFLLLVINQTFSQKLNEYKASNQITYKIGDTITLGKGSAPNGDFNYLQMGGMFNTLAVMNGNNQDVAGSIGRNYSGLNVILKKQLSCLLTFANWLIHAKNAPL